MKLATVQLDLVKKIIATNDLELLLKINALMESKESTSETFNEPSTVYKEEKKVYIFNEWQKARIDVALKQVENGDYVSDEEAQIEIERWFEQQEK